MKKMNMNKTTFPLGVLVLTIALLTALSLTGCDNGNDNNNGNNSNTPTPHQTTITAFGKEATVIGDAALSTADFNTAVGKLETAINGAYNDNATMPWEKADMENIFGGGVTIIVENTATAYDIETPDRYTMKFHINYLQSNPADIHQKIIDAVTAMIPMPQHYTNPAIITQGTPNGLAFDGSVTIKSDDPYTPTEWDAVVQKVISALNAAYEGASDTFDYDLVAKEDDGIQIVLQNDLAKNWEVKSGTKYGTLYIKTSSILSITAASYETAMVSVTMNENKTSLTNAAPAKDRLFLALEREGVPDVEIA